MIKGLRYDSYEAYRPNKPRALMIYLASEGYWNFVREINVPGSPCVIDSLVNGFEHDPYTDVEVVGFLRDVAERYQTYRYAVLSPHYAENPAIRAALAGMEILTCPENAEAIRAFVKEPAGVPEYYAVTHGREGIEWVNFVTDESEASKHVLLIGDSISWGFYPGVKEKLGAGYAVSAIQTSANNAQESFRRYIDRMLSLRRYDVIHMSAGCHSSEINREKGAYRAHITALIDYLLPLTDRLICSLATPRWQGRWQDGRWIDAGVIDLDRNILAFERNADAVDVCGKRGVPINDLFGLVIKRSQPTLDGIHYKDYDALAEQTAAFIRGI
ncbi:MAG: hypothetical protein KIG36_00165 [Eubacteriales bacterium]|nr:hypothetical protein [Eubacteriales bacterium]